MTIVVGLGFGDEGKGTIVDFLARARAASTVVRFSGGPQAGHNVVTADGRWHCFAQLGAGSFAGARTHLAPGMAVELEALAVERATFASKGGAAFAGKGGDARVTIDPACTLVTPMHKLVNQLRELAAPRGTCGMGVGEAVRWREAGLALTVGDLARDGRVELERLIEHAFAIADAGLVTSNAAREVYDYFRARCDARTLIDRYRAILDDVAIERAPIAADAIFEGAQGALLDRTRGFIPHVTQARTTAHDALVLAPGARVIGVLRAYHHRHGLGPLVTEDAALALPDRYNATNRWQGTFRVGHLDLVAARYGIALNDRVDALAITGLDRLAGLAELRACTSYEFLGDPRELDGLVEHDGARVLAIHPPTTPEASAALARAIARCRPRDWIVVDGFAGDLSRARSLADLPDGARRYLALFERLGVPIEIVSVGPDAASKIVTT
jgi:adenylosuccinate synthase